MQAVGKPEAVMRWFCLWVAGRNDSLTLLELPSWVGTAALTIGAIFAVQLLLRALFQRRWLLNSTFNREKTEFQDFVRALSDRSDSNDQDNTAVLRQLKQLPIPLLRSVRFRRGDSASSPLHELFAWPHLGVKVLEQLTRLLKAQYPLEDVPQLLMTRNGRGTTLLHEACFAGNLAAAQWLLDHGAEATAGDHEGRTPLHELLSSQHEQHVAAIAKLLLAHGASLSAGDRLSITPLEACVLK